MTAANAPLPLSPTWPVAYPRHDGTWTLKGTNGSWGIFNPETGEVGAVDPAHDRSLPALESALEAGSLLGYRAGRRAVVRTPHSFIKVVRPKRLDGLVTTHRWLIDSAADFATPDVVAAEPHGALELSRVQGTSLHQLLRGRGTAHELGPAIDRIADALGELHTTTVPDHLPVRTPDQPERWIDTVASADPDARSDLATVAARLPPILAVPMTVTHGDLHDKNIFLADSKVGLIDLDSLAVGAPEDDIANLAVHIQLRALQGARSPTGASELATRLIERCSEEQSLSQDRIAATCARTWFRLSCIYRFRTASRQLVPELLRRALDHR